MGGEEDYYRALAPFHYFTITPIESRDREIGEQNSSFPIVKERTVLQFTVNKSACYSSSFSAFTAVKCER